MPAETDNAEIQAFFEGWAIYQKVIESNFMSHRQLGDALIAHFAGRKPGGRLLDLGCGDASMSSRVVRASRFAAYHGVDLAEVALEHARANLAGWGAEVELFQADFGEFVRASTDRFDVVQVGYSLHHFSRSEKRDFLAAAQQLLVAPDGELLVYDVFCEPGESREAYLDRYVAMCRREWTGYTDSEQQSIIDHIRARDFPEDQATFVQLGRDACLRGGEELWRDHTGFHRLLSFQVSEQTLFAVSC